jgi:hypothetical protein
MTTLELYAEHGIGQRLDDPAFQDNRVFLGLRQVDPPSPVLPW